MKLFKRLLMFFILPSVLWVSLVYSRSYFVTPYCSFSSTSCLATNIFFLDRMLVHSRSELADFISFVSQDLTGVLSVCLILFYLSTFTARMKGLLLWLSVVSWNGAVTEGIRLVTQRPRPFVYANPMVLGANPAHYNSLPSGHTTFSAATALLCILFLLPRLRSRSARSILIVVMSTLVLTTATCRVLSGRHFVSDVLVSVLLGGMVAVAVKKAAGVMNEDRKVTPMKSLYPEELVP